MLASLGAVAAVVRGGDREARSLGAGFGYSQPRVWDKASGSRSACDSCCLVR